METIRRQLSDINGNAFPQGAEINGFGIDFGNGGIKVVAASTLKTGDSAFFRIKLQGLESLPSKMVFITDGKVLIGLEAVNAERLGEACSNLIGKDSLDNPEDVYVILDNRSFTSVEVLSIFMRELKALFRDELSIDVTKYPVGVSYPANFNASQRQCLANILEKAEFNIVSQQEEPIQALRSVLGEIPQGKLLVIDIGGGTSDISLQECSSQDIHILATGACSVAGIDFKNVLTQRIIEIEYGGKTPDDPFQMAEISAFANQALHDLTCNETSSITLIAGGFEMCEISRQEFENAARPLLDTIEKEIHEVISSSDLSIDQIDGVFLTGGGSLIPCIRERIGSICAAEQYVTETPLHDVALGNAIHMYQSLQQTQQLPGKAEFLPPVEIHNVISHPVSLVVQQGASRVNSLRLAQNTPIPTNVSVGRYSPVVAGQRTAQLIITCGEHDTPFDPSQIIVEATLELRPQERITEQIEVSIEVSEHGLIQIHGKDLIGGGDIQFDAQLDV